MRVGIESELAPFLRTGITVLVGTRDRRFVPEGVRAMGARIEPDGAHATVFVPHATGATTVANALESRRIAVCFTRPADHRSIQIKGSVVDVRDAEPRDFALVDTYRDELAQTLGYLGLPPRLTLRVRHWPAHAIRLRIESMFEQTPGPGAGSPFAAAARP
jgi:hypothetical protein